MAARRSRRARAAAPAEQPAATLTPPERLTAECAGCEMPVVFTAATGLPADWTVEDDDIAPSGRAAFCGTCSTLRARKGL